MNEKLKCLQIVDYNKIIQDGIFFSNDIFNLDVDWRYSVINLIFYSQFL